MSSQVMKSITLALKTIAFYLILEILTVFFIAVVFSVPLRKLFLPFVLFLIPGVVVVPLIFNARRYFHRPRACAAWFAIAMSVFSLLGVIATTYSAIALGYWDDGTKRDLPLMAAFACAVTAVTGYFLIYRRLTAKRS
jgi:uncharacterized membrane protein